MTDLSTTIAPKSDQLNADDLIAGPMTITITKVAANPSTAEQPIAIYFDGDNGKPYFACKSMRRVLVQVWGRDGNTYPGRQLTLYRDPSVKFGGLEVGGIRISHMSHIDAPITMALTATRAQRKPFTVQPLTPVEKKPERKKSPIDLYGEELKGELLKPDTLALFWANTAERRMALNVPEDREAKWKLAVDKVINPDLNKETT